MYRRAFINRILTSSFAVSLGAYVPGALAQGFVTRQALRSLPAFLDTLIPADDSPAATQLGMDKQMIAHAAAIVNYSRLLQLGCAWLDAQALSMGSVDFGQLGQQEMENITRLAEQSPGDSVQKLFFERVKSDLFTFYYSNPASWPALGFAGPPQPAGYPDFAVAPAVRL